MKEINKNVENTIVISKPVFQAIKQHIGNHRAERGGMLGRDADGVIRHFEADHTGRCNAAAYDPDIPHMNAVIKAWKKQGIEFCGFGHSHPPGFWQLSGHDKWYAGEILAAFKKLNILILPIIQTIPDTGGFNIWPFIAVPDESDRKKCQIMTAKLRIEGGHDCTQKVSEPLTYRAIHHSQKDEIQPAKEEGAHTSVFQKYFGNFKHLGRTFCSNSNFDPQVSSEAIDTAWKLQLDSAMKRDKYLARIGKGVDNMLLDETRLVVIGTGGAASLIRNCARMGFGEFVLIDPDTVSSTNIATQQVAPNSIGISKVEALGKDIVILNPAAAVLAIKKGIEQIVDFDFRDLFQKPLRCGPICHGGPIPKGPRQTILMVLTDNFWAQARGHRLGLHFGVPTICAQEYIEGRGAEVTYTVPGITPACHRCITASRYRAYMNENYKNDVTSEGAPIFAAELLNAVLGHVLLMVTHHETDHPRWGSMIERLGNKNLIQMRMDPDFDSIFGDKFGKRLEGAKGEASFFMLDSLFLAQTPDYGQTETRPVCPDCGGTGDLRDSIGKYHDTRKMRTKDAEINNDAPGLQLRQKQLVAAYTRAGRSQ